MPLEPLPETRAALHRLSQYSGYDLMAELQAQVTLVQEVVPSCVGVSLTLLEHGLTFTLEASSDEIAALDAVQYTVGGPCVDAVDEDRKEFGGADPLGLLDEERWAAFARACSAHGVLSTLSLPIHRDHTAVGGVNIYAAAPDAMHGKHDLLAAIFDAWAPGATENADLSFTTRDQARRAPTTLEERATVDRAVGVVMSLQGVDVATARDLITQAAERARTEQVAVARALLTVHTSEDAP